MTNADKVMNSQHYGGYLADIRIRIRINPEIRIVDYFWLRFWSWWRYALRECCNADTTIGHSAISNLSVDYRRRLSVIVY